MKTAILAFFLLLIGVLLMSFRVLLVKGGRFPSGHSTPELRRKGIGCASAQSDK